GYPVLLGRHGRRPEGPRLPPALGAARRPRDAVVVGCRRAGDVMIPRCEAGEVGVVDHGAITPWARPHSIHAAAICRTLPADSGGTGFSSVIASSAQNHWSGSRRSSSRMSGTASG